MPAFFGQHFGQHVVNTVFQNGQQLDNKCRHLYSQSEQNVRTP
jgi:hypothetical protein